MDPITIAAIVGALNWKDVGQKLASEAATGAAKAGGKSHWHRLKPGEREKAAKRAIELFSEEFLKELDDKSPLSAATPGYRDQLERLIDGPLPTSFPGSSPTSRASILDLPRACAPVSTSILSPKIAIGRSSRRILLARSGSRGTAISTPA
jgi:hypothetical protein